MFKFTKHGDQCGVIIDPPDGFCGEINIPETHDGMPVVRFEVEPPVQKNVTIRAMHIPRYVEDFRFKALPKKGTVYTVAPENPVLCSDGCAIYTKDKSVLKLFTAREMQRFEVPEGVRVIEKNAFQGLPKLREVILPEGLEEIGECAFGLCGLTGVTLPKSLKKIGETAFGLCFELKSINLENVAELGEYAFSRCPKLEKVSLNCRRIPKGAFNGCIGLKEITLDNTEIIEDHAFRGSSGVKMVILPWGLRELAGNAFEDGALAFTLPGSIEKIDGTLNPRSGAEVYYSENSNIFSDNKKPFKARCGMLFVVRSAETLKILHYAPTFDENIFDYCKKDGFDMAAYNRDLLSGYTPEKYCAAMFMEKVVMVLPKEYKDYLAKHAFSFAQIIIRMDDALRRVRDFKYLGCISAGDYLQLIDYSSKAGNTELTALLLQKQREFGKYGTTSEGLKSDDDF